MPTALGGIGKQTSIAKARSSGVSLSTQDLAGGSAHGYGTGVVETDESARSLVARQALNLKPDVAARGVRLYEVGPVDECSVQLDRVAGLGPDRARWQDGDVV